MGYDQLLVETDGPVTVVRMNNPAKLNALSATMTDELLDLLGRLTMDPAVRAILITGEGRGFCVGADLGPLEVAYRRGERPRLSERLRGGYNRLISLIATAPKPVIAAVNGVAAGAGVSLALACDIPIASDAATFNLAFVNIGLVPDSGASYFLPRMVGLGKALELALTGDRVDAAQARDLGLVSRAVPHEQLMSEAASLAGRLARMPTAAMGLAKRLFRETSDMSLDQAMEREAELQDEAGGTDDHMEGVLAFLEKRQPRFTGR